MQRVYIVTHRNADLDGYASGTALREFARSLGADAKFLVPEGPSLEVKNFLSKLNINPTHDDSPSERPDALIIVDVGSPIQLGEYRDLIQEASRIVLIDHHAAHGFKADLSIIDRSASSCSEIITLMFRELGYKPDLNTTRLLIGGIISDSGRFSRARPETFEAMAWLLKSSNVNYAEIQNAMILEPSFSERMARIKGFLRMRVYRIDDVIICLSHVNAFESSLAESMLKIGCDLVFIASEHDDEVRLIGRINKRLIGVINMAEIMKELGSELSGEGGGHVTAGALAIRGEIGLWRLLRTALKKVESRFGKRARKVGLD